MATETLEMDVPKPKAGDIWYRFEDRRYSYTIDAEREEFGVKTEVHLRAFEVAKVTPKGVQLNEGIAGLRFCRIGARKQFACPTKEAALESYKARKDKQAAIHQSIADTARKCAEAAREHLNGVRISFGLPQVVVYNAIPVRRNS